MDPKDKVAVVTGASKGIGRAVAERLAEHQTRLFLVARDEGLLEEVASACKDAGAPKVVVHQADLSTADGVASTVEAVRATYEGYDILVNNAGVGQPKPMTEVSSDEYDHDMAVNVRAPYLLTRDAIKTFRRHGNGGQVIQIASGLAYRGAAEWSLYCAAKYALRGFTEAVRNEVSEENIKIGIVAPGFTDTHFFDGWGPPEAFRDPITPDDVAYAVLNMIQQSERSDIREITVRNRASP